MRGVGRSSVKSSGIVGIVGKSYLPSKSPYLTDAAVIGRGIAEAGYIVMTGGHVEADDLSVKHHALVGARDAGDMHHPARLFGILPGIRSGHSGPDVETWVSKDGLARGAFMYTGLKSSERDLITGGAPDILIALWGTQGTAKEVAAAIDAGRPVVFVDSFCSLAPLLEVALKDLHADPLTDPIVVPSPAKAVEIVLDRLPGLVGREDPPRWTTTYNGLLSIYEDALHKLD
jgi:hypothetical protein